LAKKKESAAEWPESGALQFVQFPPLNNIKQKISTPLPKKRNKK